MTAGHGESGTAGWIREVRSGGQTGVDRAALDAAIEAGIPCAGWVPRGRLAEDGVIPDRYAQLWETPTSEYAERTDWNVRDADATLVLHVGRLDGGSLLTAQLAARRHRPCLTVDLGEASADAALETVRGWLATLPGPLCLNVAGPRASSAPGGYVRAKALLDRLFAASPLEERR